MSDHRHAAMRAYNKALSSMAWQELRNSHCIEPALIDEGGVRWGRPQVMLWKSPSGFSEDQPQTLTVFQPFEEASPLVRRAVWSHSADLQPLRAFAGGDIEALPAPMPTLQVADSAIDAIAFSERLNQAAGLRIPVVSPWPDRENLITDVGKTGFEVYGKAESQASLQFGWSWEILPSGRRSLRGSNAYTNGWKGTSIIMNSDPRRQRPFSRRAFHGRSLGGRQAVREHGSM